MLLSVSDTQNVSDTTKKIWNFLWGVLYFFKKILTGIVLYNFS